MRVGVLDIAAAGALIIAVVLPSPARPLKPLYSGEVAALAPRIALAQAEVARDPDDAAAAAQLADLLVRAHQSDWAVRAAARAVEGRSPERWRAQVAVSAAHVARLEIGLGLTWAQRALATCDEQGVDCPDYERGRLAMYERALAATQASGIDARVNPTGAGEAAQKAVPLIRLGNKKN